MCIKVLAECVAHKLEQKELYEVERESYSGRYKLRNLNCIECR